MYQSRHPTPRPCEPTMPIEFMKRIVTPLNNFHGPRMDTDWLKHVNITISTLDFHTGDISSRCRKLIDLRRLTDIEEVITKAKPWIDSDGDVCYENFEPIPYILNHPKPSNYHRNADEFAAILRVWLESSASQRLSDTLLRQTAWRRHSDDDATEWLGVPETGEYPWYPSSSYQNFKEVIKSGPPDLDPERPHTICYVVDSTPFDELSLRTSEVKTIILTALFNNAKTEYNRLDRFGVTLISFWDRDVRIVQGLVNFKTLETDIRASEAQRFHDRLWNNDNSIDKRFLTLLAYNSASVRPLHRH